MKNNILVALIACFASTAFADEVEVTNLNQHPKAGKETAKEHLNYINKTFKDANKSIKFSDYNQGALVFDSSAKAWADSQEAVMHDDFTAPEEYTKVLSLGKKLFETPFPNGKTFAECLPKGGKMIAGDYPKFNAKTKQVETLEMVVNQCVVDNGGTAYAYDDKKNFWALMLHVRSLSSGMKINVQVKGKDAQEAFNKGKDFFYTRQGKLNFACSSCHIGAAGQMLRSETLSAVQGQAAPFPVFRPTKEGDLQLWQIQRRYQRCQEQILVADDKKGKIGSEEFNNLEFFHTMMSNGLVYTPGKYRK